MIDKFTYYDAISNLIPGLLLVWALPILGPIPKDEFLILFTGNPILDPIMVLALSYVIGHMLQFISKYTIEIAIMRTYWKGDLFPAVFLIRGYNLCSPIELSRYISCAKSKLEFDKNDLELLNDKECLKDKNNIKKAKDISYAIYRRIDARTQDTSLAQKAHLQNTFYTFFRNVSAVFLILLLTCLAFIAFANFPLNLRTYVILLLNLFSMIVFLIRAKQRMELYIRGLFWSYD
jgi:hypothetical protein